MRVSKEDERICHVGLRDFSSLKPQIAAYSLRIEQERVSSEDRRIIRDSGLTAEMRFDDLRDLMI